MVNKSSLAKKLASYSAVAAAVLAVNRQADAQIVYTAVSPNFSGHDTTYQLDLNNDGIIDFKITQSTIIAKQSSTYAGTSYEKITSFVDVDANGSNKIEVNPYNYGAIINNSIKNWIRYGTLALSFESFGVDCAQCQVYSGFGITGPWLYPDSSNAYLPLNIKVSGDTYYGWVRLTVSTNVFNVIGYAYNATPNAPIYAGQECTIQFPKPTIQQNNDTLTTNATDKIQWYYNNMTMPGDTTQSISASQYGIYSITTGDTTLCHGTSLQFNYLNCSLLPPPIITTSGPTICYLNVVTLQVDTVPQYYSVQWLRNDTIVTVGNEQIFTPNTGGNYRAIVYEEGGCRDTSNLIHINYGTMRFPAITQSSDTLFSNFITGNTWSNGDTTQYILPIQNSTYNLCHTDSVGCTYCKYNFTYVNCNSFHPIINASSTSVCGNNSVTLNIDSVPNNYTIQWYQNDTIFPTANNDSLFPYLPGFYYATLEENGGCSDTTNIIYLNCHSVWPGDANEDLVVNNTDLLPIGLYYGDTGPMRDTTTNSWAPHSAPDWGSIQTNGTNRKFVDCNGDGIINSDDTLAVSINYGLTHPYDAPPHSSRSQSGTVPLYFVTDYPTYEAGSPVHVQVWLGSNAIPDTTIYGIVYNIGFDASAIQPNTLSFSYDSSFIGVKNKTALTLTNINDDVETAVVGTDHTNKTGYGKIGDLYFTLSQTTSDNTLQFSITNYEAVDASGNSLALSPVNDTISITNTTTGVKNSPLASESISVFPDPAKNQIIITSNQLPIQQIQIDNVLGQVIYLSPNEDLGVKHTIDINSLPAGMYFYRVTTGNSQIITGKFVKE